MRWKNLGIFIVRAFLCVPDKTHIIWFIKPPLKLIRQAQMSDNCQNNGVFLVCKIESFWIIMHFLVQVQYFAKI